MLFRSLYSSFLWGRIGIFGELIVAYSKVCLVSAAERGQREWQSPAVWHALVFLSTPGVQLLKSLQEDQRQSGLLWQLDSCQGRGLCRTTLCARGGSEVRRPGPGNQMKASLWEAAFWDSTSTNWVQCLTIPPTQTTHWGRVLHILLQNRSCFQANSIFNLLS